MKCTPQKFSQTQQQYMYSKRWTQLKSTQFFLKIVQRERERQDYMPLPDNTAKLQTAKQTLRTSENLNRDKLALINHLWKCKKDKKLMITANSFRKIDQLDKFRPLYQSR